jgi:uncharacterized protein YndB with AHSA1/START domain/catechol 2,3-dioxygenase-like lactoylglutathione lyase family enzyme
MPQDLEFQVALAAAPAAAYAALTEPASLRAWFAEHAEVSLPDKRFDFWGRFTPDVPGPEQGRHELLEAVPNRRVRFAWSLRGSDTLVDIRLRGRARQTHVIVRHQGAPPSEDVGTPNLQDFWLLSLENLRRHLDGKPVVRCDYAAMPPGDIRHSVDIDAPAGVVYDILINPAQLERWIAQRAEVEPTVGGRYSYGWPMGFGPVKILELVPNERLVTQWDQPAPSVVTWTLEASGGRTRLTLVHSGFAPDQASGGISAGWVNFLTWIRSLAEYGPAWQLPLVRLEDPAGDFYPRLMAERQGELIEADVPKLGDYVEIRTYVDDLEAARAFYAALGFQPAGPDVYSDGAINVRLAAGGGSAPELHYAGSDMEALGAAGIEAAFTDPSGLRVAVSAAPAPAPMPGGPPLARQPQSRCGKFGEFALPCADTLAAIAFWTRLGFEQMYFAEEPAPWAILDDGLILLGLHQTTDFDAPHITYFAADMADRIEALRADGLPMTPMPPEADGRVVNATLAGPGGARFFLFQGEI